MDYPQRLLDPEYDEEPFAEIATLPTRPAGWKQEPPWSTFVGPIRLQSQVHRRMTSMVHGHIQCADAILISLVSHPHDRGNLMAVPAMGFVRHTMELAMKDLLWRAMRLGYPTSDVTRKNIFDNHNLQLLGSGVFKLLESEDKGGILLKAWRKLYPLLIWWQEHDPDNIWGRYGLDQDGRPMPAQGGFDVTLPMQIAHGLFACWYRIDAGLDALQENAAEAAAMEYETGAQYEAEMRAEYEADMRAEYAGEY